MRKHVIIGGGLLLLFVSCKKNETELQTDHPDTNSTMTTVASGCYSHPIIDNMPGSDTNADTTELPTILAASEQIPIHLVI